MEFAPIRVYSVISLLLLILIGVFLLFAFYCVAYPNGMSAYYECGFDLFDMMPEVVLRQNFIPFPFHLLHLIWKPSFSFLGLYFLGQSAEWSQWKMEWHVFLNLTKFKLENWLSASSRNTASSAGLFLRLREMVLNMNRIYCYLWPILLVFS